MTWLLDTQVISELRKPQPNPGLAEWAGSVAQSTLYISAITLMEVERGILGEERRDPFQGRVLRAWFNNQVLVVFADRVLAIDKAIALRCAKLRIPDKCQECDALIAATALVHEMTVVTRNIRDFEGTGAMLFNPWSD